MNRWLDVQSAPNRSPYFVTVGKRTHRTNELEVALDLLEQAGQGKLTDYNGMVWFEGDLTDADCDRAGLDELDARLLDAQDEVRDMEAMMDAAEARYDAARERAMGFHGVDEADVDNDYVSAE